MTKIIERSIGLFEKLEAFGGQRKRRRLAQTLHLTYLRLNDCITTGEQIIEVLRTFAKNPRQFSFSDKHEIQGDGIYLEGLLGRQSENLDSLADCLHDYSEIIRALDAGLYIDLQQFIAFKGVGVDWIAVLLKRREIPFDSLDLEDLEQLATRSLFMLEEDPPQESACAKDPLEGAGDFLYWYSHVAHISQRMDANSIELTTLFEDDQNFDSPVSAENLRRLNDFLRRNDLGHHLTEAKGNLEKSKPLLRQTFLLRN